MTTILENTASTGGGGLRPTMHPAAFSGRAMNIAPHWLHATALRPVLAGPIVPVGNTEGEVGPGATPTTPEIPPGSPAVIDHGGGLMELRIDSWMAYRADAVDLFFGALDQQHIASAARRLATDPGVKGVLVTFDSPGGTVAGTAMARRELAALAAAKPTMALAMEGGMCCSAGYELASAIPDLVAEPNAIVGSIGTIIGLLDYAGLYERLGIKPAHIAEPEGKGHLRAGVPIKPEHVADLEAIVHEGTAAFYDLVAEARGLSVKAVETLNAKVFTGTGAVERKLVNAVMEFPEALAALRGRIDAQDQATEAARHAGVEAPSIDKDTLMSTAPNPPTTPTTPTTTQTANANPPTTPATPATTANADAPLTFAQADAMVPADFPGRDGLVTGMLRAGATMQTAPGLIARAATDLALKAAQAIQTPAPPPTAAKPGAGWNPPAPVAIVDANANPQPDGEGGQTPRQAKAEAFAKLCADHAKKAAAASTPLGGPKGKIKTADAVNTLRFMPQHAEGYAAWHAEGGKPDPRTFLV